MPPRLRANSFKKFDDVRETEGGLQSEREVAVSEEANDRPAYRFQLGPERRCRPWSHGRQRAPGGEVDCRREGLLDDLSPGDPITAKIVSSGATIGWRISPSRIEKSQGTESSCSLSLDYYSWVPSVEADS
jgi:hypothetical protein